MRRDREQHLAFRQRLPHQPELVLLEVAEAAVDQLAGRRRRAARQIALLDQKHAQAAADGIAGDADTVDAAADDEEVVYPVLLTHSLLVRAPHSAANPLSKHHSAKCDTVRGPNDAANQRT